MAPHVSSKSCSGSRLLSRDTLHDLHQRSASPPSLQGRDEEDYGRGSHHVPTTGIPHQPGEIWFHSLPENGVSGLHSRFGHSDSFSSHGEIQQDSPGMLSCSYRKTYHNQVPSPSHRANVSSNPGSVACPLFYMQLQRLKNAAFKRAQSYDAKLTLDQAARQDLSG